jgi:hypothetical protein
VSLSQLEALGRKNYPQIAKYAETTVHRHIREVLDPRVKAGTLAGDLKGYHSVGKAATSSQNPAPKAAPTPPKPPAASKSVTKPTGTPVRTPPLTEEQAKDLEAKAMAWVESYWSKNAKGVYGDIVKAGADSLGIKITSRWQEFVQKALVALKSRGKIDSNRKGWSTVTKA